MNLLVQHYQGPPNELVRASSNNMRDYAQRMGADYMLLTGWPLDSRLTLPCQKLAVLMPRFDAWDTVVVVDTDMFAVTGLTESIFDIFGIGWYHDTAHPRVCRLLPGITSRHAPFWGGAVYRLKNEQRVFLRPKYNYEMAAPFSSQSCGHDEGIMHRLAVMSGWTHGSGPLYFSKRWCWGSYEPEPEKAAFIHVRPKPTGDKLKNYHALRERGIIT